MSDHLPVVMQFQINEPLTTKSHIKKPIMWFESANVTNNNVIIGINSAVNTVNNKLSVYNSIGQLVKTIAVNNQSSVVVSANNLESGIYFIKMQEQSVVLKFIKK